MNIKANSLATALLLLSTRLALGDLAGTAFTYQGRLNAGTTAATGWFDFAFSVWNSTNGPAQIGTSVTNLAVPVTNGLFTVTLDFGPGIFDGSARWLEIGVRTNNGGLFASLSPRQPLGSTPYAQYAISAAQAAGVPAGAITTAMLADGAVGTSKIGPAAVKSPNIDDGGSSAYESFLAPARSFSSAEPLPFSALAPVSTEAPAFSFRLDSAAFGTVAGFSGREGMSDPYAYVVAVITSSPTLDPNAQIGRQAQLIFARGGKETSFAGLVTGCSLSSYDGRNALYTFRIESPLAYLALTTDYRIYQQQDVPAIATDLFQTLGRATPDRSLTKSYAKRELTMQFAETSLNFFSRLLEDAGIFYFFDPAGTMVLGDAPSSYRLGRTPSLPYYGNNPRDPVTGLELVRAIQKSTRESTGRSTIDAYDFVKPALELKASTPGPGQGDRYQFGSSASTPSEVQEQTRVRQERHNLERATLFGSANCPDLRPGYTFALDDRTDTGLAGEYLVTAVQHAAFRRLTNGVVTLYYGNQFEVIPAAMPYHPALKAPKPLAQPCTANVTGPAGHEVYVDKYGRVKVQFHWDRYGTNSENSSAWIRAASPAAGKDRGLLFLPRVGDEVLVGFVQGDPDQPVVLASYYNGAAMPPEALPGNQTVSTIKTRSVPAGAAPGANEIRFEDKTGAEELRISAAKDLVFSVNNNLLLAATNDVMLRGGANLVINSDKLRLSATQGIGIGTTNDPAYAVKVSGTLGATALQGDGSGLNNISAAALTGTINDARLSGNVPRLNATQTFAGANSFLGRVGIGGTVSAEALNVSGDARLNDFDLYLRGNNADVAHGLGWYGADKPFGSSTVDGPVLYGCGGGSLGTTCGGQKTVLVWNNAGNVGIGTNNPGARLDVAGAVRAASFSGDGSALSNLNAANLSAGTIPAARLPATVALLNAPAAFSAAVSATSLTASGDLRVGGLQRLGSETGTSQAPATGLVTRRLNSTSTAASQVVARTDKLTLERDGTNAGLLIRYPAAPGYQTINGLAINNVGTVLPIHTVLNSPGTAGTVQLFADSQRVVHLQLSFGNVYNNGAFTQVVLDRHDDGASVSDSFWVGTLASSYNQ